MEGDKWKREAQRREEKSVRGNGWKVGRRRSEDEGGKGGEIGRRIRKEGERYMKKRRIGGSERQEKNVKTGKRKKKKKSHKINERK